ncbi:MAG: amidohydrolase family protein [Pseudomonadota bacterium]
MTDFAIANANVMDVHAGSLLGERTVLVEDGIIVDIVDGPASGDVVVDLSGLTLMPGLCDGHVHVTAATPDFALLGSWSPSYVTARAGAILNDMLMRGFTTVRDAGGADHGLAQAVDEGYVVGPRILFAGKALSQTGGHGDMRTPGQQTFEGCFCCAGLGRICDGVSEVRRAARDEIRKGATQIKIMGSGGVSSPTDRIDSTQFSVEEISAIVEEADAANIYAMSHAYTARAIERLLECGVRTIEHGNLLESSTCEAFLRHDAYLVPTLSTYHAIAREGVEAGMPEAMQRSVYEVLDAGTAALEMAYRAGVNIVYGTDLLGDMHTYQLEELSIRSGIVSNADIIRSATCTAAQAFQREGEFGEVAVGASADLIALDGNPLDRLDVLADPSAHLKFVMKAGQIFKSELD